MSKLSEMYTKITLVLNKELVERLRNAAYWREEPLAQIIDKGIRVQLRAMEHSNGKKYKQRPEELKAGRPKKVAAVALLCLLPWFAACGGPQQQVMQIPGDGGKAEFVTDKEGRIVDVKQSAPHYKVITRISIEAWSVSQISYQTVEHCSDMYTSEQMAMLKTKANGAFISQYTKCHEIEKATVTTEPGKWSYFQGPLSAALIAGGLAYGLSSMDFGSTNNYGGSGGSGLGFGGNGYGGSASAYAKNGGINLRQVQNGSIKVW